MRSQNLSFTSKGNLTEGPIPQHLFRLTVPMIWGILAIMSFQLVDTFYVSLLGKEDLAALSFTFPLNYMVFSLIIGFGIAMSSVVSRLIGEGDHSKVQRVTGHGLILVFIIGFIIANIGIIFHDSIFRLQGADEQMIARIRDYMIVWFSGMVFITVPLVGNSAIRAAGDSLTPSLVMLTVAVVNIVLDPILIFGLFGFPRLELQGAALATVFANVIAMLAGLYVIYAKKKMLSLKQPLEFHLFGDSIKRILTIALPAGLTNAIQPAIHAFILALIATYGTESVAAFGIVSRIEAFAFVILMALSVGLAPIVGQNWGANRQDRVQETLKLAILFNFYWSAFIAIILGLFARSIAQIFSVDIEIVRIAVLYFWIVPFSYAFANLIKGWASAFNAIGKPQYAFFMIIYEMIILTLPAVIIGNSLMGIKGIFLGIAAANLISGTSVHIFSKRFFNQQAHKIEAS